MASYLNCITTIKRVAMIFLAIFIQFFVQDRCFAESEVTPCEYANVSTLPIGYLGNRAYTKGTINKTPVYLLISTGSNATSITEDGAKKLQLPLQDLGKVSVGITGERTKYTATISELSVGPIHIGETTINVIRRGDPTADGVLGASTLFTRDVEINPEEGSIKFYVPTKQCAKNFLAYWDQNASSVDMEVDRGARFNVMVEINGKKIRALVNTSAPSSKLNLKTAANLFDVTPTSPGVVEFAQLTGGGKHMVPAWLAPFNSFTLGEETIKNPKIIIADLRAGAEADGHGGFDGDYPDMILGADFFKPHRVLFAVSQDKMYFSYIGGDVFMSGEAGKNQAAVKSQQ